MVTTFPYSSMMYLTIVKYSSITSSHTRLLLMVLYADIRALKITCWLNVMLDRSSKRQQQQYRMEEVYTDKDRAAAVNLGSRDIKQSLKLKRRQDISRIFEISEEEHPGILLSLGNHELRNKDVKVAINFVNKVKKKKHEYLSSFNV